MNKVFLRIKFVLKFFRHDIFFVWIKSWKNRVYKFHSVDNYKNIPIIINNRDRLYCLKLLINWLIYNEYTNIHILDNDSQYQPLLNYYQEINDVVTIHYLKKNLGFLALWRQKQLKFLTEDFYVYTDPDVLPIKESQSNLIELLYKFHKKYPKVDKVGCALKISDLDYNESKSQDIVSMEKKYWSKLLEDEVYKAAIDTTFALYKPKRIGGYWVKSLRVAGNCSARHLPWYKKYIDENEENFYRQRIKKGNTHWTEKND